MIIAPLREEDVSLKPKIKLFHDVLYDSEIEKIKKLAKTKVKFSFCTINKKYTQFLKSNEYKNYVVYNSILLCYKSYVNIYFIIIRIFIYTLFILAVSSGFTRVLCDFLFGVLVEGAMEI